MYTIKGGVIKDPGKFESCPEYAPYFYEFMVNGFANDFFYDDSVGFVITHNMKDLFPALKDYCYIRLIEDGFVYTGTYTHMPDRCYDINCGQDAVLDDRCYQCGKIMNDVKREMHEAYLHCIMGDKCFNI